MNLCDLTLGLFGCATHAREVAKAAPEIDPAALRSAVALVVGGVLVLVDRSRKLAASRSVTLTKEVARGDRQ